MPLSSSMKERLLEPFTSLEGRLLPLPIDKRRLPILASYWIFAVIGAVAWWFLMNNPAHVPLGDLSHLEQQNSQFQASPLQCNLRIYSTFPIELDFSSHLSSQVQFNFNQPPQLISITHSADISALDAQLKEILPIHLSAYNLVLIKSDTIVGESFYSGNDKTFISFIPSEEAFDLRKVLGRLEAVQFKTLLDSIAVRPLFRIQKLRFLLLSPSHDRDSSVLSAPFNRFFGPFLSALEPFFEFDVRFQQQLIPSKLPEDFSLSAQFFSGSRPIARFNENDEIGPERPFRFVLLDSADSEEEKHVFIPDWGVVVQGSFKDSSAFMQLFIAALRKQLGFPAAPFGAFSSETGVTAVELDVFRFALEKAYTRETLRLLQLSSKLRNEPISPHLHATHFRALQLSQPQEAFIHAHRLHYDQSRLGAPYFPDEHKFAVYLPVVFPLVLPLLVGLLKYLKSLRQNSVKSKAE